MIEFYKGSDYVKLKVLGYEFDQSEFQEDLEWLNLSLKVNYENNTWLATGSHLTIKELQEISNWIEEITNFDFSRKRLNFMESEIAFGYDDDSSIFSIFLDFNFHPKGKNYDYNNDSEVKIDFSVNSIILYKTLEKMKETISCLQKIRKIDI